MYIAINLCFILDTFCQHLMLGLWMCVTNDKIGRNSSCVPTVSERHSEATENIYHLHTIPEALNWLVCYIQQLRATKVSQKLSAM
jgi:hypothetical protein